MVDLYASESFTNTCSSSQDLSTIFGLNIIYILLLFFFLVCFHVTLFTLLFFLLLLLLLLQILAPLPSETLRVSLLCHHLLRGARVGSCVTPEALKGLGRRLVGRSASQVLHV